MPCPAEMENSHSASQETEGEPPKNLEVSGQPSVLYLVKALPREAQKRNTALPFMMVRNYLSTGSYLLYKLVFIMLTINIARNKSCLFANNF